MDVGDISAPKDEKNLREIPVPGGNKVILRRTDPYGFIVLSLERGSLPEEYRDLSFTTWAAARQAISPWIAEQEKAHTPSDRPQIKLRPIK